MLGGIRTDLLVTVALLALTQTGTQCRAENDFSLVTLPEGGPTSEYVAQCYYDRDNRPICDWTRSQIRKELVALDVLESPPLGVEGKVCVEFWYLAPATPKGSELRVLLKSSTGLVEIWTSPVVPQDAWRQVFVPLNIIEPGSQVVFEEVQARSSQEKISFKQMRVRRGSCGHQCESNTALWTDEFTHCLCSAGQLLCFPSQCPKGQICGPETRSSNGTSTSGICTIHRHTDCSTFDGVLFRFMAPCAYVLAKTCSPTKALPEFSVEVVNEQNGNVSLPTVQQIIVNMGNIRVSLLKGQTHRVVVNGVWRKVPLSLSSGTINIESNPAAVVLATRFGLSVSIDKAGAIHVTLPSTYSNKVCGLCGNFNHLTEDDLLMPNGTHAEDATDLAESWQSGEAASSCETILVPHQCEPLEQAQYASELYCGALLSSTGPFADCLSVLGAESYFRSCVFGMCSSHGDPAVLCETLQLYAEICHKAGGVIPTWRNSTFCPLQCGENSHYNSCADGCPEVCSSLDIVGSCGSCEERCECDSGFKLSGEKCVPAEDCGCWYKGKHYEKGETLVEGDCVQQCRCMGNDAMQCSPMQCTDSEICKVDSGVKGCFPFKPVTCSVYGDPHYITFDKLEYQFQGGCSYTLTTTCSGESSVQFSVIGYNMHPPNHNFTRSKLEAVGLEVDKLFLTLNQSGEVYVHNSLVQLPYSTNDTYGSVLVYNDTGYIILETTFGLKMGIDMENRLFLQVDERYKYELCGLCGTYSGHQDDDFLKPGGQSATDAFEFGDSWKVPDNNECIAHPNDPRLCDYDEENEAHKECSVLFGDAFKPCHEHIHPSIYFTSCVYDYCDTGGDQHTLCESLKSYAAACHFAGVKLPHWESGTVCADPPTTAVPPTSPNPTTPTPDHTLCPLSCNFENNICGWEQLIQDSFDWTRHSGPTPSHLTGPNQDHTTGAGFYIYLEGDNVTYGDPARLLSSTCHYNGPLCLHFWYNMYGSATTMALNIYLLKDTKATKLWSMLNNQGPEWHLGNIDIDVSGPFQIILEGIRGSTAESDVAIDDISIHFSSCSGIIPGLRSELSSTTAEVLPSHPVCNLDCSFDSNLCSWNQMVTDAFDWTWQKGSTPTLMTGPSADHTGDGHYLYIEANSATHGDTARLISSECSDSGPQCLQFWYHMYGSADTMGLHVYLIQNSVASAVWRTRNDQGNMWHLAQVDIKATRAFQIIFEGRRGSNDQSDVAIDDVKLYHGRCSDLDGVVTAQPTKPDLSTTAPPSVPEPTTAAPEPPLVNVTAHPPAVNVSIPSTVEVITDITINDIVTETPDSRPPLHPECQLHCNFERDLCQWSQMLTDVFDWTWHSGSTPTMRTGPSSDHTTGGGHYLYIEANSATHGDTARLISSECSDSGPQCLQFWYHMYGSADTMGLHVYLIQNRLASAVWRTRNDQGNMWHLANVDLATTGAFQILFEGRRGSNEQSDVAIDDVSLHRGHCADLANPTTPAATARPQPLTTVLPKPETTARPQPPSTVPPEPQTTVGPQPPSTVPLEPETTARPQPPSTVPLEPETTARPQPLTTFPSEQETTARPQPPSTVPLDPETTPRPQPLTTVPSEQETTARPQPPNTVPLDPETTPRPQPLTTVPSEQETTARPQPPSTVPLEPETTARPQPPSTVPSEPQTTARPKPLTTVPSEQETTARPQPPNTVPSEPQTTARPQPPSTVPPEQETTVGPQPPSTVPLDPETTPRPQPLTTVPSEQETTARPQPPNTVPSEPQTTARPQPPSTVPPEQETTVGPQPPSTVPLEPETTARQQPLTTFPSEQETTARPQPPNTVPLEPQTTARPQPPSTVPPEQETTVGPQPPNTVPLESETTARPQPLTTVPSEQETTARPQPPSTVPLEPQTTPRPQPPSTVPLEPQTTARPQPPSTVPPEQETTVGPQPPNTVPLESETTARPQPLTTVPSEQETTARPQPPSTVPLEPQTTPRPQPPSTVPLEPQTTPRPQPPTTVLPEPQTTARPQPPSTYPQEPETTAKPQPPSTVLPEPQTTARPQPPSTYPQEPETTARPQPTTTPLPTPSCPVNSHYTTCIPACTPTCAELNGPPHCSDNVDCVAGCVCNDGFVRKRRGCVPVQQCGCVDRNGLKYQFNQVWYTSHCSQKCECEKDDGVGKIDCDDEDECDGNAVCLQNEKGNYYCQSTGFSECTIKGDPEYRTFDKMKHDFEGEHSYVLVRTSNLPNNLPDVYIEGINTRIVDKDDDDDDDDSSEEDHSRRGSEEDDEDDDDDDDDDSEEDTEHHRLQGIKIRVYNHTVEFKKKRRLIVDGERANPPVSPAAGLNIREHSSRIYLKTDFGLSVEFDGHSSAEIVLPRLYRRKVGGLCGNFDGNRGNDKTKPDGTRASSTQEFGESWRV